MLRCGSETRTDLSRKAFVEIIDDFAVTALARASHYVRSDGKQLPLKASPPAFELLHQAA